MKKVVYAISLFSVLLLLNIVLTLWSSGYQEFLREVKYGNTVGEDYLDSVTDELRLNHALPCVVEPSQETSLSPLPQEEVVDSGSVIPSEEPKKEVFPSESERNHIESLMRHFSKYMFTPQAYNEYFQIFGITDEYPEKYVSYTFDGGELYFFPKSNLWQLKNIFQIVGQTSFQKYEINQVNLFRNETFFLNVTPQDEFIRVVMQGENILFWLKIKKQYYSDIKSILLTL